jgi:hypothetical protein
MTAPRITAARFRFSASIGSVRSGCGTIKSIASPAFQRLVIGVLFRQDVDPGGQRIEPLLVEQVMHRQLPVFVVAGDLRDLKEILRDDVGLVVGRILLADTVARHRRHVGQTFVDGDRQQPLCFFHAAQLKRVHKPDDILVHDVRAHCACAFGPAYGLSARRMNSPKPATSRVTLSCAAASPVAAPSLASPDMYCPSVRPGTKPLVSYHPPHV